MVYVRALRVWVRSCTQALALWFCFKALFIGKLRQAFWYRHPSCSTLLKCFVWRKIGERHTHKICRLCNFDKLILFSIEFSCISNPGFWEILFRGLDFEFLSRIALHSPTESICIRSIGSTLWHFIELLFFLFRINCVLYKIRIVCIADYINGSHPFYSFAFRHNTHFFIWFFLLLIAKQCRFSEISIVSIFV